jgi:Fe-S-cluster containining protein
MWIRSPSIQLCAQECGAKCCRAPGSFTLSPREAGRLQMWAGRELVLRAEPGGFVRLNFSENGGACPALAGNFTCSIYPYRPVACHRFPQAPDPRCAVWPT